MSNTIDWFVVAGTSGLEFTRCIFADLQAFRIFKNL